MGQVLLNQCRDSKVFAIYLRHPRLICQECIVSGFFFFNATKRRYLESRASGLRARSGSRRPPAPGAPERARAGSGALLTPACSNRSPRAPLGGRTFVPTAVFSAPSPRSLVCPTAARCHPATLPPATVCPPHARGFETPPWRRGDVAAGHSQSAPSVRPPRARRLRVGAPHTLPEQDAVCRSRTPACSPRGFKRLCPQTA